MSTRTNRGNAARSPEDMPVQVFTAWADLPRRQFALMTQSATAVARGSQELARIHLQQAMQYWGEFARVALQMQADMLAGAGEAFAESGSEPTLESLQRAFEATLDGAASASSTH